MRKPQIYDLTVNWWSFYFWATTHLLRRELTMKIIRSEVFLVVTLKNTVFWGGTSRGFRKNWSLQERIASIISVTRIGKDGTTPRAKHTQKKHWLSVLQLLLAANVVPTSLILSIMISSETSVLTGVTRRHIPEDDIIQRLRVLPLWTITEFRRLEIEKRSEVTYLLYPPVETKQWNRNKGSRRMGSERDFSAPQRPHRFCGPPNLLSSYPRSKRLRNGHTTNSI
jgi:hypothetical protein